jgi:hypothetical protein
VLELHLFVFVLVIYPKLSCTSFYIGWRLLHSCLLDFRTDPTHPCRTIQLTDRNSNLNLMWDCTHLILYNVQSHTTSQIWQELQACLGELVDGIVKVKHVSGLNCNPHADVWVWKDVGSSLLSCIHDRTRVHMVDWGSLATTACRSEEEVEEKPEGTPPRLSLPPQDEGHSVRVQGWRLALWQPGRERQMKPPQPQPHGPLLGHLPTAVVTYNANGYLSKLVEIEELLDKENVAVLVLQETLVMA